MPSIIPSIQNRCRDYKREEDNLKLVVQFYEDVFIDHDIERGVAFMADDYVQHNPAVPAGKQGFIAFFKGVFAGQPGIKARLMRVAADGDLVWINAHFTTRPEDPGFLVVDMFRVQDGMLVEHWDVMQNVPEASLDSIF